MNCSSESRRALGVAIGAVYILVSFFFFSRSVISYFENKEDKFPTSVVVLCLVVTLISALFVLGIVKKNHHLIFPWLVLCVAGFFFTCLGLFLIYLATAWIGEITSIVFIIGFGFLVWQAAIYWFSSYLYQEIHRSNNEASESLVVKYESGTKKEYMNL